MKYLIFLFSFVLFLAAEDLDDLLNEYTYNSDLSKKTKLESGGTVTIYTRKDLETMQARSLKDLLKSHPIIRYRENRYGISDMNYRGGNELFISSNIKIYIDNQELTSAGVGSGFVLANNIGLNAIDHVEIYSQSPSYEFSTEPTALLIKLYSKVASRDRGGKAEISAGSRGHNQESIFYADEYENFSYVASLSRLDNKKRIYSSYNIPIQRNSSSYNFFGTLYSDKHKLQLMAGKSKPDLSLGTSLSGTNQTSDGEFNYLHISYETSYFDNIFLSAAYQQNQIISDFRESSINITNPYQALKTDTDEKIFTTELKYNLETKNNRIIIGSKLRFKKFELDEYKLNYVDIPTLGYNKQNTYSIFAENRYSISDNSILNFAAQYSYIDNNSYVEDDDLLQLHLSFTYLYDKFVFKTFAYRVESLVEPYIYSGFLKQPTLNSKILNAISEEVKYDFGNSDIKLLFTYGEIHDLFINSSNSAFLKNSNEDVKSISSYVEYTYNFDINNKIISNISYEKRVELDEKNISGFIRSLNVFGKFEVFNEVIYNYTNLNHKDYYDYSAGIKYHYNQNLSLSIKGENIFDKAYEDTYSRINPTTGIQDDPIKISPIEQKVYFTLEYLF